MIVDPPPRIPPVLNPFPPEFFVIVEFWIIKLFELAIAVPGLLLIVLLINDIVPQLWIAIKLIPEMELWRTAKDADVEQ